METITKIVMPKLGLTMIEGLISEWQVKPGDNVKPGDVLVIIETDKIANELEATHAGRIASIEVEAGATVPVGQTIATWTGPGMAVETAAPAKSADIAQDALSTVPALSQTSSSVSGRTIATPLARRIARNEGIEIEGLIGSGPNGRVRAVDIKAESRTRGQAPPREVSLKSQSRPATHIEKIVARRLTESKQTIPHFYVLSTADIGVLERLRLELNVGAATRISVNHFIIAAAARALAEIPQANALWQEGEIVTPATIDIGIAVDSERGLVVPVLSDTATMTVDDIARLSAPLVARARDGKLQPGDMEGGVMTVSNVGMFGVTSLVPIINPGQAAILGVGTPQSLFRPDEVGAPSLCREISLVLSCDHRVMNGVLAARLLDKIRFFIENAFRLLRK